MNVGILIWMVVLHFISDFLLQSREMGQKKSSELKWLLKHICIIFSVFLVGLITVYSAFLKFSLLNAIIHMVIDANTWKFYKLSVIKRNPTATTETWKYWNDPWFYHTIGLDQTLHILTIIVLWSLY